MIHLNFNAKLYDQYQQSHWFRINSFKLLKGFLKGKLLIFCDVQGGGGG